MRRKAWPYQIKAQVEKFGADNAPWHVGWVEPDGQRKTKSMGAGRTAKRDADRLADKLHSQIVTGTYETQSNKTWDEFYKEYDEKIISREGSESATENRAALKRFAELTGIRLMKRMELSIVDGFTAKRRRAKGRMAECISPATVNKDLRYIKKALRVAHEWGYIPKVPRIVFLDEPEKLATYMSHEHFAKIYDACESATLPNLPNARPSDWWKALLVTAYLTGWRVSQILAIRRADVDLKAGTAISRARDNKGKRDTIIRLHPIIVDHLRAVEGAFGETMLPWPHHERTLWRHFGKLQESAGIPKAGKEGWYGFHDARRGFATENAEHLDLFELQALMQHRSLETTRLYVSMARSLKQTESKILVPDVLTKKKA